jgi:hypothetical protein
MDPLTANLLDLLHELREYPVPLFPRLRRDYGASKIVVFNEPPAIDRLLPSLARLEFEINNLRAV